MNITTENEPAEVGLRSSRPDDNWRVSFVLGLAFHRSEWRARSVVACVIHSVDDDVVDDGVDGVVSLLLASRNLELGWSPAVGDVESKLMILFHSLLLLLNYFYSLSAVGLAHSDTQY